MALAPAPPIDLTAARPYMIAENDFMAAGGDGYPNFFARAATQTSWTRPWPTT